MAPRMQETSRVLDEHDKESFHTTEKYSDGDAEQMTGVDSENLWPEVTGNWFQQTLKSWTYCYMRPLLRKGKKQSLDGEHLTQDDLYDVPEKMKSEVLVSSFS
jgi:hypothetical protein